MRRHLTTLVALLAMALPALADAPFLPNGKAPDHVVTMVVRAIQRKEDSSRTYTHHAGWTRIDELVGRQLSTRYFGHADAVLVHVSRNDAGGLRFFDIRRNYVPFPNRDSFKTGETRTILGETCNVWNVMRSEPAVTELARLSCVTEDGIELAYQYVSQNKVVVGAAARTISSGEATRIERRAVLPSEVRPPVEALNLKAWNELINQSKPTPAGAPGDYEIVIEGQGEPADGYTRIVRRHHPWTFRDERGPDGIRTASARNEVSLFSMSITFRGQHGTHTLLVNKFTPAPPQVKTQASGPQGPKDLGRNETVLGEVCHWFDVHPGLMDAGLHECRTSDGVVLKETQFARGRVHNLIATRFTRRPVAPSEVAATRRYAGAAKLGAAGLIARC